MWAAERTVVEITLESRDVRLAFVPEQHSLQVDHNESAHRKDQCFPLTPLEWPLESPLV